MPPASPGTPTAVDALVRQLEQVNDNINFLAGTQGLTLCRGVFPDTLVLRLGGPVGTVADLERGSGYVEGHGWKVESRDGNQVHLRRA